MKIEFLYSQILPTAHPEFTITVAFECEAIVNNDIVVIESLKAAAYAPAGSTAWQELSIPGVSTLFAGLLREKAREAAAKWKQDNF